MLRVHSSVLLRYSSRVTTVAIIFFKESTPRLLLSTVKLRFYTESSPVQLENLTENLKELRHG